MAQKSGINSPVEGKVVEIYHLRGFLYIPGGKTRRISAPSSQCYWDPVEQPKHVIDSQVYTESTLVEQSTPVALQFQDRDLGVFFSKGDS